MMNRAEAIQILDPETGPDALAVIEYYHGFNGQRAKTLAVLEAISVALAALRELTQSQWISVKERLPENEGNYLVASEITGYVGTRHFYRTCPEAFTWQSACTHWMPLPELNTMGEKAIDM